MPATACPGRETALSWIGKEEGVEIKDIPFEVIDLARLEPEEHAGVSGRAFWRTAKRGDLRIRIVD